MNFRKNCNFQRTHLPALPKLCHGLGQGSAWLGQRLSNWLHRYPQLELSRVIRHAAASAPSITASTNTSVKNQKIDSCMVARFVLEPVQHTFAAHHHETQMRPVQAGGSSWSISLPHLGDIQNVRVGPKSHSLDSQGFLRATRQTHEPSWSASHLEESKNDKNWF